MHAGPFFIVAQILLRGAANESHTARLSYCFYNSGFTPTFYTRRAGCYVALSCYSE